MAKWAVWLIIMVNAGLHGQELKFGEPSCEMFLDVNQQRDTLKVKATWAFDPVLMPAGDTIWFRLAANGYSSSTASVARELLKSQNTAMYFARPRQLCSLLDLEITAGSNPVRFFFSDDTGEYIGIRSVDMSQGPGTLTFSYRLAIPTLTYKWGNQIKKTILRYFYPQPAPYQNGIWNLMPDWRNGFNNNRKTNILAELHTAAPVHLISNGDVNSIADGMTHHISAPGVTDLLISLSDKPVRYTDGKVRLSEGREVPYTVYCHGRPRHDDANTDKLIALYAGRLDSLVGPYPYGTIKLYINPENADFNTDNMASFKMGRGNLDDLVRQALSSVWVRGSFDFSRLRDADFPAWLSEYYSSQISKKPANKGLANYSLRCLTNHKFIDFGRLASLDKNSRIRQTVELFGESRKKEFTRLATGDRNFATTLRNFATSKTNLDLPTLVRQLRATAPMDFEKKLGLLEKSSEYTDYAIVSADPITGGIKLTMENNETGQPPFSITMTDIRGRQTTVIHDGFSGKAAIDIKGPELDSLHSVVIDKEEILYETRQCNNYFYRNKKDGRTKLSFRINGRTPTACDRNIDLVPLILYNDNDRWMPAFLLSNNRSCNTKSFTFNAIPAWSFKNKNLVGQGELEWNKVIAKGKIQVLKLKTGIKSFDFNTNEKWNYSQRYLRVDPGVTLRFHHQDEDARSSYLTARGFFVHEQYPEFSSQGYFEKLKGQWSKIYRLSYNSSRTSIFSSGEWQTDIEQQSYTALDKKQHYLKLSQRISASWLFGHKRHIDLRVFAAGFILNTARKSGSYQNVFTRGSIPLIYQGFNDYTYEEMFFSRQNQNRLYNNQVSMVNGGGFKTPLGSASSLGMSNNWAAAINVTTDLPFRMPDWLPLKLYFDAGTYSTYENQTDKFKNNFIYNGGMTIRFKNEFSINLPLVYSRELGNAYREGHKSYFSRISFGINMQN